VADVATMSGLAVPELLPADPHAAAGRHPHRKR
jgi:hypothetical protein